MTIIATILFALLFAFWFLSMLVGVGVIKGGPIKRFCHDKLGWHDGEGQSWFDGCSIHSICSQCGEEVMQDGQGNWF